MNRKTTGLRMRKRVPLYSELLRAGEDADQPLPRTIGLLFVAVAILLGCAWIVWNDNIYIARFENISRLNELQRTGLPVIGGTDLENIYNALPDGAMVIQDSSLPWIGHPYPKDYSYE